MLFDNKKIIKMFYKKIVLIVKTFYLRMFICEWLYDNYKFLG